MKICSVCYRSYCDCGVRMIDISPIEELEDYEHGEYDIYDEELEEESEFTAADIYEMQQEGRFIRGFEFLGRLPDRFKAMAYGLAGNGKSSFALMFANATANRDCQNLYCCIEESIKSNGMIKKLRQNNIRNRDLHFTELTDLDEIADKMEKEGYKNVFLDSVSYGGYSFKDLKDFHESHSGFTFYTTHVNKKGQFKGITDYQHFPDIEINMSKFGIADIRKNRISGEPCTKVIFEKTQIDEV